MSTRVRDEEVVEAGVVPVAGDVVAGLRAAIDAVLAVEPRVLADGESVLAVLREVSRLEAVVCRQAAAFDVHGEWAASGAQNSSAWVTTRWRGERQVARRRRRLGHALASMRVVDAAFAAGRISVDHVEVLARVRDRSKRAAAAFVRDEAMLVEWAATRKMHHFRRDVDEWFVQVDGDEADRLAQRQRDDRRFDLSQSFQGMWFADGVFDPISGAAVKNVLSSIEDELFRADWAAALRDLGREPRPAELARTAKQRRVDALVEMATRAATAPANGRRPVPLVTVLVGDEAFARSCRLASGTVLASGTLVPWLDDADIERIVFDGPDRVMAVGRARAFRGALRRAIEVRDRECTHEFCDVPADRCQADHIRPHAAGGATVQSNGRCRCGFHNRLGTRRPTTPKTTPVSD